MKAMTEPISWPLFDSTKVTPWATFDYPSLMNCNHYISINQVLYIHTILKYIGIHPPHVTKLPVYYYSHAEILLVCNYRNVFEESSTTFKFIEELLSAKTCFYRISTSAVFLGKGVLKICNKFMGEIFQFAYFPNNFS